MNKSLPDLYRTHSGKGSDKWQHYLHTYDQRLSEYKNKEINFLEIGIQNGGSLEIWAKFFSKAKHIVGCDINPKCSQLNYEDQRISVLIGNICNRETESQLLKIANKFDVIIDDGSHFSSDIIKTFIKYFPYIHDEGLYVIEDLHCSYWENFDGGVDYPYSSVNFFKSLVDIINADHWCNADSKKQLLSEFKIIYGETFSDDLFDDIASIEFSNSLCFIKKSSQHSRLGERVVVGEKFAIHPKVQWLSGTSLIDENQKLNHNHQYSNIKKNLNESEAIQIQNLSYALIAARNELAATINLANGIYDSASWRVTKPLRFMKKCFKNMMGLIWKSEKYQKGTAVLGPDTLSGYLENNKKHDHEILGKQPILFSKNKISLIVHVFYPEILIEILDYLKSWPFAFKLYITTPFEKESKVRKILNDYNVQFDLILCDNKGRDVLPFLKTFETISINGGIVLKLHTKRSLHRTDGDEWRKDIFEKLLSVENVSRIIKAFNDDPKLGVVVPSGTYVSMKDYMGDTEAVVKEIAEQMGGDYQQVLSEGFSVGTMFYIRRSLLQPILDLGLTSDDFQMEAGQIDGTMAHALERGFFIPNVLFGYYVSTNANPTKPADILPFHFHQHIRFKS